VEPVAEQNGNFLSSFLNKHLAKKVPIIILHYSNDKLGYLHFWYLAMYAIDAEKYSKLSDQEDFEPEKHFAVLADGRGFPNAEMLEYMHTYYGAIPPEELRHIWCPESLKAQTQPASANA
jgi:hypothetical protein